MFWHTNREPHIIGRSTIQSYDSRVLGVVGEPLESRQMVQTMGRGGSDLVCNGNTYLWPHLQPETI